MGTRTLTYGRGSDLGGRVHVEDPEDGHLCSDGFSGAGGSPQQDVGVRVVECVEDLRLNGIKVRELVETLVLPVSQRGHRQRLKVQELWN